MNILCVLLISAGPFLSLTWTTKTPMPQALAGCGCAAIADTIFVIGGRDSSGNRYATNYIYLPGTDAWSTRANMPTARAHLGAAYVNGKIYAIGGWTGSTTGACEEYDPVSDTWQVRASMPTPRYTLAIAAVAGKIYVFGGMNSSGQVFNTVEEYDPVGNSWSAKTSMPTARMGPACAVVRDTVYVYGGSTVVGGGLTTVNQYYVPGNDTWGTKASLPSVRYCAAGFTYQNKAFSLGGYDFSNYLTLCNVYDPSTNVWSSETPMQNGRQSLATVVIGNCVYAIGGWNNGALGFTEEGLFTTAVEEQDANALAGLSIKVSPNPFRDRTVIRFSGKGAESAINEGSIKIYNATGCLVNSFALSSSFIPHPLSFSWNGTDQSGRKLPDGVYLLVAEIDRVRQSQKLIIAR